MVTLQQSSMTGRYIASAAVMVAGACTMSMNATFGWALGNDTLEKVVLATFSAALDVCKIFGLLAVAYHFERGSKIKASIAFAVWIVIVGYSAFAAIGFAALTRNDGASTRVVESNSYERALRESRRVQDALDESKRNERWISTNGCTDASVKVSKEFCNSIKTYTTELAQWDIVLRRGKPKEADPQAATLAAFLGTDTKKVQFGLSIFLGLVAEIVSSLGMYAFSNTNRKDDKRLKENRGTAVRGRPRLVA